MKELFIKTFFGDEAIQKFAHIVSAFLFSLIASYIPGLPESLTYLVGNLFNVPDGGVLTEGEFIAVVAPTIIIAIDFIVKHYIAEDNKIALETLKQLQVYDGELDCWVGPKAQKAIKDAAIAHRILVQTNPTLIKSLEESPENISEKLNSQDE